AVKQLAHLGVSSEQALVELRRKRVVACKRELERVAQQADVAHDWSPSEITESPCFLSRRSSTYRFLSPSAFAVFVGLRSLSASGRAIVSRSSSPASTSASADCSSSRSTSGVRPM